MAEPAIAAGTAAEPTVAAGTAAEPAIAAGTAAERVVGGWLDGARPALRAAYAEALPGARAAVLARLWTALAREPIPGLGDRHHDRLDLVIVLPDGRRLRGPAALADPFAPAPAGSALTIDGVPHDHPAALLTALRLAGHTDRLAAEVAESVANLALARCAQPAPDRGRPVLERLAGGLVPDPLAYAEQLVVDGHPLHPCCRTRLGMSPAEVLAYAPEHRPVLDLELVEVPTGRWLSTGTGLPPRLPVHPWQRDHLLTEHPGLRTTGERWPARPLMSLRTLALVTDPRRHLKTAVNVQMTSAVRTVSPAAVHNGPAVSALLATLTSATPRLVPLAEVAAGAVLVDGVPSASLAVVLRNAPAPARGEVVLPLAVLASPSPADGRPLVVEAVAAGYRGNPGGFLDDLVNLLLGPAFGLLHRGVALEAHAQNTLVGLVRGRPVRAYYRDTGGLRVSPWRLARHGVPAPALRGDLISDDPAELRGKLGAALLGTAVAEVVAVLAGEYGLPPQWLWKRVGAVLRAVYARLPREAAADAAALTGDVVAAKALTAMRLADDPRTDRWYPVPNPLAGAW